MDLPSQPKAHCHNQERLCHFLKGHPGEFRYIGAINDGKVRKEESK